MRNQMTNLNKTANSLKKPKIEKTTQYFLDVFGCPFEKTAGSDFRLIF
jgi:hypothetical protein